MPPSSPPSSKKPDVNPSPDVGWMFGSALLEAGHIRPLEIEVSGLVPRAGEIDLQSTLFEAFSTGVTPILIRYEHEFPSFELRAELGALQAESQARAGWLEAMLSRLVAQVADVRARFEHVAAENDSLRAALVNALALSGPASPSSDRPSRPSSVSRHASTSGESYPELVKRWAERYRARREQGSDDADDNESLSDDDYLALFEQDQ